MFSEYGVFSCILDFFLFGLKFIYVLKYFEYSIILDSKDWKFNNFDWDHITHHWIHPNSSFWLLVFYGFKI